MQCTFFPRMAGDTAIFASSKSNAGSFIFINAQMPAGFSSYKATKIQPPLSGI
jgi:hypothetical protein